MTTHRVKTYASSQGYVYEYYFVEKYPADDSDGTEYVFSVTSDRKESYSVHVVLPRKALSEWSALHGRGLSDPEQYAGVKVRLFRAFDDLGNMQQEGRRLEVDAAFLEESLASLGVE